MRTAAEAADELEAFAGFYGALAARVHFGDHVCLAAHPREANGSVEDLIEIGVEDGTTAISRWVDELLDAVDDKSTPGSVLTALGRLEDTLDLAPFATVIERSLLQGTMLGALDSEWEREHEEEIAPARFAAGFQEGAFSSLPYADALELFQRRQVLPRPAFDALQQGARRQAFTVARMAKAELINTAKEELGRQLRSARKQGEGFDLRTFRRFAKERLESAGWTPANKSHVETIFRTNAVGALASGRFVEMRKPAVLAALPYWQIRGVNDSRARPTHKAAFGVVLPANHTFWLRAYPPFGYNCLLPGTAVRGNFTGASRARYAGKAIELTTAKGRRLSVTANHPVLTRRGFVPARELREGDELVSYRDEPGVELLRSGAERNEHEAPAKVDEVFGALAQAGGPLWTRAGADDFHGEATRFRGEVEVVGSYANLPREWYPALGDELPELVLEAADTLALGLGASREPGSVIALPSTSFPRCRALTPDRLLVALQRLPFRALRVALPAQLDAVLTEDASEGLTRDAELVGKLLEGGAGLVTLDQVRHVREFEFCGHVYDAQTVTGWLAADSIVVSNCRCRVTARSAAWLQRTGTKIGPVPRDLPDPGFDSGTSRLISIPDAALAAPAKVEAPRPAPTPPPAPPQYPPPLPPLPAPRPGDVGPRLPEPFVELDEAGVKEARDRLAAEGITLDTDVNSFRRNQHQVFGRSLEPAELKGLLGNPAEIQGAKDVRVTVSANRGEIKLRAVVFGKDEQIAEITRYVAREEGVLVAHNALMDIAESQKGKGIATRLQQIQLDTYEKLGVKRVELTAAWDGQYVWPRMGYRLATPDVFPSLRAQFAAFLHKSGEFASAAEASAYAAQYSNLNQLAAAKRGEDKLGARFLKARGNGELSDDVRMVAGQGLIHLELTIDPADPNYQQVRAYLQSKLGKQPKKRRAKKKP